MDCKVNLKVTCQPLVPGVTPEELYAEEERIGKMLLRAMDEALAREGGQLSGTVTGITRDHEHLREVEER